jgi:hypothetical protein
MYFECRMRAIFQRAKLLSYEVKSLRENKEEQPRLYSHKAGYNAIHIMETDELLKSRDDAMEYYVKIRPADYLTCNMKIANPKCIISVFQDGSAELIERCLHIIKWDADYEREQRRSREYMLHNIHAYAYSKDSSKQKHILESLNEVIQRAKKAQARYIADYNFNKGLSNNFYDYAKRICRSNIMTGINNCSSDMHLYIADALVADLINERLSIKTIHENLHSYYSRLSCFNIFIDACKKRDPSVLLSMFFVIVNNPACIRYIEKYMLYSRKHRDKCDYIEYCMGQNPSIFY